MKEIISNDRLLFIDSLRGIASLAVMLFHFYNAIFVATGKALWSPFHQIFIHGELGVQIFFVLSGFVIAKSIDYKLLSTRYVSLFIIRRAVRLDPPYWVIIFLTVALIYFTSHSIVSPSVILLNAIYLDNLLGIQSLVAVGWTLQYEFQFYLVFIVILYFTIARWSLSFQAVTNMLLVLFFVSLLSFNEGILFFKKGLFIDYWFLFLGGVITNWVLDDKIDRANFVVYCIGILALLLIDFDLRLVSGIVTVAIIFVSGMLGKLKVWLSSSFLVFLGTISYSLYLIHPFFGNKALRYIVSRFTFSVFESILLMIVFSGLCILLAYLFFKAIEKPSIRLSKTIARWGMVNQKA